MKGKKAKFTELRARLHVAQRPVRGESRQTGASLFKGQLSSADERTLFSSEQYVEGLRPTTGFHREGDRE